VTDRYVPGYDADAVAFMSRRSAETHAAFVLPRLAPGTRLLDCGCGPGAITVGLARRVAPGLVVAVDREPGQTELTRDRAAAEGLDNVEVLVADAASLPFPEGSFDAVFSHALIEHLSRPVEVLAEFRRVLAPGGMAALAAPDFGGFLLAPPDDEVERASAYYRQIRAAAGGDPLAGRRLGLHLAEAGFSGVELSARYEVHDPREPIVEHLAGRIERSPELDAGEPWAVGPAAAAAMARVLRAWGARPDALFAQCWVTAVAWRAS
jgi:ubiquinone/menaquinone biosynthesis C-methylase UbiE